MIPSWVKAYGPTLARWMSLDGDHCTLKLDEASFRQLHLVLRRDWAVRVLDAWSRSGSQCKFWTALDGRGCCELIPDMPRLGARYHYGPTADAARLAAAEAVWPELPESVRAELGEQP